MKTLTITVYDFDELSDKAKEKARDWYRNGMFQDTYWYESTYEDAKNIGLEITEFDCYHNTIDGKLTVSVGECVRKIIANHGATCETYATAQNYFRLKHEKNPLEEKEFVHALLEDYLAMLRREVEYMESNECVDENIRANEYTFTIDGKREG